MKRFALAIAGLAVFAFAQAVPAEGSVEVAQQESQEAPPPPPPRPAPPRPPKSPEEERAFLAEPYCSSEISVTRREVKEFSDRYSSPRSSDARNKRPPQPKFPAEATGPGRVVMMMAYDRRGRVIDSLVVCSDGPEFSRAALASMPDVEFEPGEFEGERMPGVVLQNILFVRE